MKIMCHVSCVLGVMMLQLFVKGLCYSFEIAGMCFWFSTQRKPFHRAVETCKYRNGKLVQLDDQEVFEMITDKVLKTKRQLWVGLTLDREGEKTFRWGNNASTNKTNWLPKEPNYTGGCVRLCRTYGERQFQRHGLADQSGEFSIARGTQQAANESLYCPLTSVRLDGSRLRCAEASIMKPTSVGFVYNKTMSSCTMFTLSQSCPDNRTGIAVTAVERQCSSNAET